MEDEKWRRGGIIKRALLFPLRGKFGNAIKFYGHFGDRLDALFAVFHAIVCDYSSVALYPITFPLVFVFDIIHDKSNVLGDLDGFCFYTLKQDIYIF